MISEIKSEGSYHMWSKAKLPKDIAFWINQRRKKDAPLRSVPSQTPGSGAKHGWYGKWRRRRRASWQLSQTQTFPANIGDYVSYETVEVILWAVYQVWIFWTPSSCVLCKVIQDILSYLVHFHAVSFCRHVGPGWRGSAAGVPMCWWLVMTSAELLKCYRGGRQPGQRLLVGRVGARHLTVWWGCGWSRQHRYTVCLLSAANTADNWMV